MKTPIRTLLAALVLGLSFSPQSRAESITWTNTAGGNWGTAENWSPNQVPNTGDSVTITGIGANVRLDTTNSIASLTLLGPGSLTVASNGVLNLTAEVYVAAPLTNQGVVHWLAGNVQVASTGGATGEVWNEAGGLWDIRCDQALWGSGGVGWFHNSGTVRKSAGTLTTGFDLSFDNSGTAQAQSGTIQFQRGGNFGGVFQADAGAAMYLGGAVATLSAPPVMQGPGTVQLNCSRVVLEDFVGSLTLYQGGVSGRLASNGVLNVAGSMVVSFPLLNQGVLNLGAEVYLAAPLTNQGVVHWLAGNVQVASTGGASGEVWNEAGGLWDIQCDQPLYLSAGVGWFHNSGTVRKSAGNLTTGFDISFDNSGTVQAQSGTIAFQSASPQTAAAKLEVSLGGPSPGSGFGRIEFSTAPTFAGRFTLSTRDGFRPNPGDTFSVLGYPSAAGDFTCMNGLDLGAGLRLSPRFTPSGLVLTAVAYETNALPALTQAWTLTGLLVSWPPEFTGWELRSATNLGAPVWLPIPVAGTNNTVVPKTLPEQYYQLSKPE